MGPSWLVMALRGRRALETLGALAALERSTGAHRQRYPAMNGMLDSLALMKSSPLGPPPLATSPAVSRSMKGNRGRNTLPERELRAALIKAGAPRFSRNMKDLIGRPDIVFGPQKLAVFMHGCYWHRCPHCRLPMPKTNVAFWRLKFERNTARDSRKARLLRRAGWSVLQLWECRLKRDPAAVAARVMRQLAKPR